MAELAYVIIGKVIEKLGSVVYQELGWPWGVKSDLKRLKRTMSTIRAVLLDAEKKQASNPPLNLWLGQLNDVLHDADDVFDEIEYQASRKQVVATYGSTSTKVRHFCSSSMTRAFPFKLAYKIKGIRKRLDEIAADKNTYNLTEREDGHIIFRDTTHSFVDPSTVIGRDKDKENIIKLLMRSNAKISVDVIPIVGLGGLGKTTLAKLVYNNERVVRHFKLKLWICVSNYFGLERLIKEILKSARGTIDENWNLEMLQTELRSLLKDKRFLLVVDDAWNEDSNRWIELRDLLIGGSKGSKIIVTTRCNTVATCIESIMSTAPAYNLKGLSQYDCLSLFIKCAFNEGEDKQHPNLLKIGKEIVKKCEGVPLAVRTLGCLLYSEVDQCEWESVRDKEIWELKQNESGIFPVLRLSYDKLPIHLKRCFAFCSLFPKGHIFDSDHLIQLWMAHGVILLETSSNKKQDLEKVGDLYINELLSRSFFHDKLSFHPYLYCFKMHDLIHDLAISVAQECSIVDSGNKDNIVGTVRHLSFSKMDQEVPECLNKSTKVRTVMFNTELEDSLVAACILRFKYLRYLNLSNSSFEVLPSSIGNMKHLRYFNLSFNKRIKELPNSICKLHNLQTLLLDRCTGLKRLPIDIRNMISLRCLQVTTRYTCLLENGSLKSLRYLLVYDCPGLEVLFQGLDGCVTNLRTLEIDQCASLTSLPLKHLIALETLIIDKCPELSLMGEEENQDLKLSLQSLTISSLPKLKFLPQWLQGSDTLQYLKIKDCENFMALPDWLPTLKSLHTLKIFDCPKLSSLPEGTRYLTKLRELKIIRCHQLSRKCRREDHCIAHVLKVKLDGDTQILDDEDYIDSMERGTFSGRQIRSLYAFVVLSTNWVRCRRS